MRPTFFHPWSFFTVLAAGLSLAACSDDPSGGGEGGAGNGQGDGSSDGSGDGDSNDSGNGAGSDLDVPGGNGSTGDGGQKTGGLGPQQPELWYSSGEKLIYIEISEDSGEVVKLEASTLEGIPIGHNSLTMLEDGSLLGARLTDDETVLYHVADPPRDGSDATYETLGVMPDKIGVEGLYTDCAGRVYVMDTGEDHTNSVGNRLLLFTGDILGKDFSYAEISDLSKADVADIDDMGPGIDEDGEIRDNPGIAIDTGSLYVFNYETGSGTKEGAGGTYGTHVLGGPLFADDKARVYVLESSAELYEVDVVGWKLSDVLVTGPGTKGQFDAHSSLTGPLSSCVTGFTHTVK